MYIILGIKWKEVYKDINWNTIPEILKRWCFLRGLIFEHSCVLLLQNIWASHYKQCILKPQNIMKYVFNIPTNGMCFRNFNLIFYNAVLGSYHKGAIPTLQLCDWCRHPSADILTFIMNTIHMLVIYLTQAIFLLIYWFYL